MNLLLLSPSELSEGKAVLTDKRAEHIFKVLKAEKGAVLKAGIINGPVGKAVIIDCDKESVTVAFTDEHQPPKPLDITLILALPRPKAFRRILFGAICAGVKEIHLINSWRVEKSYWASPYISDESIKSISIEALSQSKDTIMPKVVKHRFFTDLFEKGLSSVPSCYNKYIAHPYADKSVKASTPSVIAIGPEGGFIERELATFAEHGFTSFSLSDRVFTTEHFVPFLLGSLTN